MAFVSSPSSTNEVNTNGVNTTNTQVSPVSTKVSTAGTQDSTANLSDATVYAFLASQPNGNRNQDNSRRTVNVEETASNEMVAIDGAGFNGSYMADDEVPTNMALMAFSDSESLDKLIGSQIPNNDRKGVGFVSYNVVPPSPTGLFSPPKLDLSNSGLEEFQQPEVNGYGPKISNSVSENICNKVKESTDAPLLKELVSNDMLEKKTVFPTVTMIKFVRPKQQKKPVRKPVKNAKMYRLQCPRGNQRKWNNQKSQQLGSDFVMYNKACFVCGSFDHVQANCNYHQRERMVNVVKASACWVWRPTKLNSASITLKKHNYIDARGISKHMTGNMSYLIDFKEFNRGYVTFGGGAKGEKITGKGTLKTGTLDFKDMYFVKELQS
nr:ribonuclease H-like domain-containing protein [Tanacetum cinerariifolium]